MSKFFSAHKYSMACGCTGRYNTLDFIGYSNADFETGFHVSAQNEGGYVNDPNDMGGETYRGIARNYNSKWEGWRLIDAYKAKNGAPKKGFTSPEWDKYAFGFYKKNFWDPVKLDQVNDQATANQIYDHTLSGLPRTVSMVKAVLNNKFGYNLGESSTMNQDTLNALNKVDAAKFNGEFKRARADFFTYSAAKLAPNDSIYYPLFKKYNPNPKASNQVYLTGWLNRVNKYAGESVAAAVASTVDTVKNHPIITSVIAGISVIGIYYLFINKSTRIV